VDHKQVIRDFIIANFLFGDADRLDNAASFLKKGIVDSTGILEVVQFLETTFHIAVNDDELLPENLDSVDNISNYVNRKLTPV
jgi:acyl carrier protein